MEEIKLLSQKEESELSYFEQKKYYDDLRSSLKNRTYTNLTPGALFLGPKLKYPTNQIAEKVTKLFSSKDVHWISDGQEKIPEGPVILAHTHQGILDGFVWIPEIDRHCFILHGSDVNKLLLLCQYNTGLVLTKKALSTADEILKNNVKLYNRNAKLDMIGLLLNNYSISYFPEGTWNLSPNKIHLPMRYGFLDVAKKAGVPVIPVVHEYTYESTSEKEVIKAIHSRFGDPIYVAIEDDLSDKLIEYQDQISTMRWDLMSEKGLFNRKDISVMEYINFLKGNYKNLKLGRLDIEMEQDNIFGSEDEFYKFHHINAVSFNEFGELEPTEEVKKLEVLNKIHNI